MRRPSLCNLTMQKPSALSLGIRMFIIANTLFKDNMFVCVRPCSTCFFNNVGDFWAILNSNFTQIRKFTASQLFDVWSGWNFHVIQGGNVQFIRELPRFLKSSEKWTGGCTSGSRADGQVLLQLSGTKGCKSYRS